MPFIFRCSRCGSTLCEDPKPVLDIGSYKRQTYLESILTKLGSKCPFCGHKLRIPPSEVEVFASKKRKLEKTSDVMGTVQVSYSFASLEDRQTLRKDTASTK